jgi:hypothetical protein
MQARYLCDYASEHHITLKNMHNEYDMFSLFVSASLLQHLNGSIFLLITDFHLGWTVAGLKYRRIPDILMTILPVRMCAPNTVGCCSILACTALSDKQRVPLCCRNGNVVALKKFTKDIPDLGEAQSTFN